jgi:CheY-like chemotaxis protein
MNTILGMSELIRTDNLDAVQLRLISDIRKMSHTLLQIINDILDFSKIEAGKLELSPSDYDIVSLMGDIHALTKVSIGDKTLELRHSIAPGVPKVLFGDEVRVRQIITNILNNAVKYTQKGYVGVHLSRITRKGVDCLAIRVKDTGIGIKEEDFPRLFDAFEQANSAKNNGIMGTGLGLTITKRLLDLMAGDISFESTYGVGSEFSVYIPIIEGDASNIHQVQAVNRIILAPETKVLVVDDNELNLTVAQGFLLRHGITPDTSMSAKEAIRKIKNVNYDIVFMDQMMPDIDGIEATRIIRSIEGDHYKQMPIVALTAYSIPNAQRKFLEAGMNDFILKPIDANELNRVLLDHLPPGKILGVSIPEKPKGSDEHTERIFRDLRSIHDLDLKGGVSRVGSADVYINILRQFCNNVGQYNLDIAAAISTGDWKAYYINMHALKTVLANIGNSRLSAWAFSLEKASKNGDIDTCKAQSEGFIQDMENLRSLLLQSSLMEEAPVLRVKKINSLDLISMLDALHS